MLTQNKIEEIESLALDTLAESFYNIENVVPPIKTSKILQAKGLKLEYGNFSKEEISGYFDRSKKSILISEKEPYVRQIFTIAHEIGHFLLHNNVDRDVFNRQEALNIDNISKDQEQEANWFAASLLMPEFLVKRFWIQFKTVKQMANIFQVSHATAFYRLKNLGLLEERDELRQLQIAKALAIA